MARPDLPLDQLREYRSRTVEPADFDQFWQTSITGQDLDLDVRLRPVDNGLRLVDTVDVTFAGFGGSDVKAWLHLPAGATGPLPTVVTYIGYSGGRGQPHDQQVWPLAGYAHLLVDSRGQGWSNGTPDGTADPQTDGAADVPGVMTRGVLDPDTYYYRRLYVDVARSLLVAASLDQVDAQRIVVAGGSQGGALTIAAAGLASTVGVRLLGAMPDVPFLCDFRRAVDVATTGPYVEIENYLKSYRDRTEQTFATLNYIDGVHHAARADCPTLFSVALRDTTCPPSTVFAAFHAWPHPDRRIEIYEFNNHEGGQSYQVRRQLDWLAERL